MFYAVTLVRTNSDKLISSGDSLLEALEIAEACSDEYRACKVVVWLEGSADHWDDEAPVAVFIGGDRVLPGSKEGV
jgi:hypothetical protein